MSALEELLSELREVCAGLEDKRLGQACRYTMADMAAFSVFFLQSPSFLGHQRALAEGHGRSSCQTLLGMAAIPSDNHIRQMLDGSSPAAFDGLFIKALETVAAADGLPAFQRLGDRLLIALDGTEHHCSRKIGCPQCSTRRRSDGGVEYFHSFLGASVVAPGHTQVLPLPAEFITPQDRTENRIANGPPPSAGWPAMARALPVSGRSIWATTSMPVSRSSRPSRRAAATSS
jgi:hypothetical protein